MYYTMIVLVDTFCMHCMLMLLPASTTNEWQSLGTNGTWHQSRGAILFLSFLQTSSDWANYQFTFPASSSSSVIIISSTSHHHRTTFTHAVRFQKCGRSDRNPINIHPTKSPFVRIHHVFYDLTRVEPSPSSSTTRWS